MRYGCALLLLCSFFVAAPALAQSFPAQSSSNENRCHPQVRVEMELMWNQIRGFVFGPAQQPQAQPSGNSFNQGCALVMTTPELTPDMRRRWTLFGRVGVLHYRNELGDDEPGGVSLRRTGPKVGTVTIGIRKEF